MGLFGSSKAEKRAAMDARLRTAASERGRKEIDAKINAIDKLIGNEKDPKVKDALRNNKGRLVNKRRFFK